MTNHGYQTTTEGNVGPHQGYSLPSPRILGPSTIGLVAFLGFNGFCIAVSGPATMTILQVSTLAAFCLMLAGLCRWICRCSSEAAHTEERFRRFFEYAASPMLIVDSDQRFVHVNHAYSELLGYDAPELLGRPVTMVAHPEDIPEQFVLWDELFRHNKFSNAQDKRYIRKDGRVIWVRATANLFTPSDGTAPLVMAVVENITERKQAELVLRQGEARLIEAIPQQVWTARPDGTLDYVNRRVLEYFDAPAERLLDWEWQSVLHPDDLPACMTAWTAALQTGEPYEVEFRLRQGDEGVYRWYLARALPIRDEARLIVKWIGTNTDISRCRQVEEALRESEERLRVLYEDNPSMYFTVALDGRVLSVNRFGAQQLGYRSEELMGRPVSDVVYEEDQAFVRQKMAQAFTDGMDGITSLEFRKKTKGGTVIWVREQLRILRMGEAGPVALIVCEDISVRKQMEAALAEREEQLRLFIEHSPVALAMLDREMRYLAVSRRWRTDCRVGDEPLIGRSHYEVFPEISERGKAIYRRCLTGAVEGCDEDSFVQADGRTDWSRWEIRPWLTGEGDVGGIVIFSEDITARKQAEDALRTAHAELEQRVLERTAQLALANRSLQDEVAERKHVEAAVRDSELRYKLLTEATFDGIAIHDQGILIEVNAGLERMFRYEAGELIGRSILDLVADESRDMVVVNMREGVSGPYEAMGRRKDGTTFPGEVVVRPYCYRGKEVRLVAGRDITERKHLEAERVRHTEELERQVAERTAEITKLESQRAQTEKLAAMGRLAAGVAHEINNPIAGIKNAFTLVKQAVDPAHPHAEFVGMIDREIARVASIVQNMYQLYRPESGKGEAVKLQTMLHDIEALFAKRLQQRRLVLVIDVDSCIDRVSVPRGDLLQVLLNLLNNAIDCSSEGGTITLTLRANADAIRIAVSDQGPGIPPEHFPHIFDPFFTTKTGGDQKGMGLGLSISQSLVMAMGGKIEVQTRPNDGSTFSVILPRHTAVAHVQERSNIIKEVVTP
ncbi:MAG: PAS domain S-box protein [Nitrospira sp.]|nr:PAS domain S-box protein [Nitrospira sp.]